MFMLLAMGIFAVACEGQKESDFKVVITSSTEVRVGKFAEDVVIHYDILGIEDVCAEVNISNANWLRVSKHESDSLVISVADNETGAERMAAVTLSYEGSTATAIISQSAEATEPVLESLSGSEITLERMGTVLNIEYRLENRNPVDYVFVKSSADWIYSINTEREGVVSLGIATNKTKALRETVITVGYGSASFDVKLSQRGDGDINFRASKLSGEYLGDALTPGVGNYWFILSDRGFKEDGTALPSATYYRIDAYAPAYQGYESCPPIANGTYTFDKDDTYAEWTFTAEYSGFWVTNTNGKRDEAIATFESGTMTVESGKVTLDVVVNGEAHHVVFVGDTTLVDNQSSITIYSTLDGDYDADLSNHYMVYECYGDYYDFGYTNWMFVLAPENGYGDCFQFDIITGYQDIESGFTGDYISSDFLAMNSFIPGWTDGVNMQCSWFFTANQSEVAPLRGGEMSVKENPDGTFSVDIKVKDDLRNTITGHWTGVPQAHRD